MLFRSCLCDCLCVLSECMTVIARKDSYDAARQECGITAWYAFGSERLGQGKENVRAFLQDNDELRMQIERALLEQLGMPAPEQEAAEDEKLPQD